MVTSPMNHQLGQSTAMIADTAQPVSSTSTAPPPFVRRSGRGQTGCGRGEGGHNMEKGVWQHVFILLISTNKCKKSHSSYLMLVNWKLPYVVCGVCYILIPICPCFCWFTVLQHACEWSVTAFFWKKYSIYSSMLRQVLAKSNLFDIVSHTKV